MYVENYYTGRKFIESIQAGYYWYRFGKKRDLKRWFLRNVLKKEDVFFGGMLENPEQKENDEFWALHDVSFEINEGDVWGIVGRNGAGKSTLLKILSRITRPTSGVIRGNGKISSLLEVGTGFHSELTGRENVYISGHFLGMTRQEIKKNFDEIVWFSGIEQFIDTPVKKIFLWNVRQACICSGGTFKPRYIGCR